MVAKLTGPLQDLRTHGTVLARTKAASEAQATRASKYYEDMDAAHKAGDVAKAKELHQAYRKQNEPAISEQIQKTEIDAKNGIGEAINLIG